MGVHIARSVKRHKGEMAHAVYPQDVCAVLLDRFPASKDVYIVVTATQIALDLDRTTAEVMKCFERNLEEIEGRMFELGINAKVKPARVVMTEAPQ